MGHDIREAKGSEKKRSGFELTAAECSKSALVVRVNEDEFELPTVVQENKQFGCNTICGFEGTFPSYGPVAQLVRASPCHGEGRRFESDLGRLWDLSSAGRASALQAEGHRFEPCRSHFFKPMWLNWQSS